MCCSIEVAPRAPVSYSPSSAGSVTAPPRHLGQLWQSGPRRDVCSLPGARTTSWKPASEFNGVLGLFQVLQATPPQRADVWQKGGGVAAPAPLRLAHARAVSDTERIKLARENCSVGCLKHSVCRWNFGSFLAQAMYSKSLASSNPLECKNRMSPVTAFSCLDECHSPIWRQKKIQKKPNNANSRL